MQEIEDQPAAESRAALTEGDIVTFAFTAWGQPAGTKFLIGKQETFHYSPARADVQAREKG